MTAPNEADAKEVAEMLLVLATKAESISFSAKYEPYTYATPGQLKKVCTRLLELEEAFYNECLDRDQAVLKANQEIKALKAELKVAQERCRRMREETIRDCHAEIVKVMSHGGTGGKIYPELLARILALRPAQQREGE